MYLYMYSCSLRIWCGWRLLVVVVFFGCCSFVFWFSSSSSSSFFFFYFKVYKHSFIMLSLFFVVVEIREIRYLFPMSFVMEVKTGRIHSHYFISNTIVSIQAREWEM